MLATLLISLSVLGSTAAAEPTPTLAAPTHLGVNLIGGAGFLRVNVGSFTLHVEHVFAGQHGVRLAGDFVHIHQNARHVQSHQWTFGGSAAYRYYFAGDGGGSFAGALIGYRRGFGHFGDTDDPAHTTLRNEQLRALAEVGNRWFPHPNLSITTGASFGYGPYDVQPTNRDDEPGRAAARFSRDNLAPNALILELELSIAWSFALARSFAPE